MCWVWQRLPRCEAFHQDHSPVARTPSPLFLVGGSTRPGTIRQYRLPSPPFLPPARLPTPPLYYPFPLLVPLQDWIGSWLDVPYRPCALPQARILRPPCLLIWRSASTLFSASRRASLGVFLYPVETPLGCAAIVTGVDLLRHFLGLIA